MLQSRPCRKRLLGYALFCLLGTSCVFPARHALSQAQSAATAATRQLGTVKSIASDSVIITTDAGQQIVVRLAVGAKVVKLPAGSKDMKDAQPIELKDVEVGDRVLVRGQPGESPGTLAASSVIVMKGGELQQKREQQQEDWQKRGIGGLVSAVDLPANTLTVSSTRADGVRKTVIHLTTTTRIRRYAPDSVKFEDAQPGTLTQIKPGDQLRARGVRNGQGDFDAEEIVSGSFLNVAGTVVKLDSATGVVQVKDATNQKMMALKVSPDSQLLRLPAMAAQMFARRASGSSAPVAAAPVANSSAAAPTPAMHSPTGMREGGPDLQQMLGRLPKMPLNDLHPGDAVMVVSTPGSTDGEGTVITLLAGVEAILAATPKGGQVMTLSPWNINGSPGDSSTTP